MEYVHKIIILNLKKMVKSGLENIFEIPPCAKPFLLHRKVDFCPNCKFSFGAWRNFKKNVMHETVRHKFHPYSILST